MKSKKTFSPDKTREKVSALRSWIQERAFEWRLGTWMVFLSLLSWRHALLVGDTGTSKSTVIRMLVSGLEGFKFWTRQFHQDLEAGELVGYPNAPEYLKTGVMRWTIANSVFDADILWCQELCNGRPGLLTTIMNLANGEETWLGSDIFQGNPLIFSDTNDIFGLEDIPPGEPEKRTLVAFFNRIPMMYEPPRVLRLRKSRAKLAQSPVESRRRKEMPPVTISKNELLLARENIYDMAQSMSPEIEEIYLNMVDDTIKSGCRAPEGTEGGGNRWYDQWREICAADAWMRGVDGIDLASLKTLRLVGPRKTAHLPIILEIISDYCPTGAHKIVEQEASVDAEMIKLMKTKFTSTREKVDAYNQASFRITESIAHLKRSKLQHPDEEEEFDAAIEKMKKYQKEITPTLKGETSNESCTDTVH